MTEAVTAIEGAKLRLRRAGYQITRSEIPGLFFVDKPGEHHELTIAQLIDLANRQSP